MYPALAAGVGQPGDPLVAAHLLVVALRAAPGVRARRHGRAVAADGETRGAAPGTRARVAAVPPRGPVSVLAPVQHTVWNREYLINIKTPFKSMQMCFVNPMKYRLSV